MPREPFVFDATMRAMGAPEENGRAAETGYFGLNACGERTSRHRTLHHYNTHCGSSCERSPPALLASAKKIENRRVDSAAEAVSFVAQDQQRVIDA
jgi:hypothetical protein